MDRTNGEDNNGFIVVVLVHECVYGLPLEIFIRFWDYQIL